MSEPSKEDITRYRVACDEVKRLESLLNRGHIKSLQDFRRIYNARIRRDELAVKIERRTA